MDRIKCTRCKVSLPTSHYKVKRNGDYYKQCELCNKKQRERISKIKNDKDNITQNTNITQTDKIKCTRCKVFLPISHYKTKRNGDYYKQCEFCSVKQKESRIKNLCVHKKELKHCIDCGGASMCIHNRRKSRCKDCEGEGASICEDNIDKGNCKVCNGSQICEHKKIRSKCKDCKGGSRCKLHNRLKNLCKECGGSDICPHGKNKHICADCDGNGLCIHRRQKCNCVDCKGSQICDHSKRRHTCIICNPKRACPCCLSVGVDPRSRWKPYCFRCYCSLNPDIEIPHRYKMKEHHLRDKLKETFPNTTMVFDKKVDGGCSLRRPDVRIECYTHSLILEGDENGHIRYDPICENRRTMEIFQDLGNRPLVLIRFNFDSYKDNNKRVESCFKPTKTGYSISKKEWNKRIERLKEEIEYHMNTIPDKEITEVKLFYSA